MENTIENAAKYLLDMGYKGFANHTTVPLWMKDWADKITADRDRTIADLRRQLSECKAKGRIGLNNSDNFGL